MEHPINILERYWGFTSFKPLQEDIIESVLTGEDTLALLPTGGGKSLCYQIPGIIKEGICIVISPLIALMKDQVMALKNKGIKAMAITSGISYNELDTLLDNCIYGDYKFLYLSPERLQQELVQERLKQMHVSLIAVDEAHCISQWGNDFRPAYKNIISLRQLHPHVTLLALTASATKDVIKDITATLDFLQPKIIRQSFYRPNLAYMVFNEQDKYYRIEKILKKYTASSIIYVRNRKSTFDLATFLNSRGIAATYYHGGLSNSEKEHNMSQWMHNAAQVMVATNAFGMGIDKPDVKTVIHINLPDSIESYFQEAGRVGRNGEKAFAVILKSENDNAILENQFLKVLPSVDFVKVVYRKLCNYFKIPYGEGSFESFSFNFNLFCKTYDLNTILSYNALLILDRNSIISLTTEFINKITVQFLVSSSTLFEFLDNNQNMQSVVKSLLRLYGGIFDHETKINTIKVAEKASTQEEDVIAKLKTLEAQEIISLKMAHSDVQITFIEPREDDKTINRIAGIIIQQNNIKQKQVHDMIAYVSNDKVCKSMQLLSYFGEKELEPCGICSVCSKKQDKTSNKDIKSLQRAIIELLKKKDLNSRQLSNELNFSEEEIVKTLQLLLELNTIMITEKNTYKLSRI